MADTSWQPVHPLINDLLNHGHEFSFSQVMRVARMHLVQSGAPDLPEAPWQDRVRIRPELSLAFPAADVARVEPGGYEGAELLITATFLGLYGSSSPLPTHYSEDLLQEAAADSSASRDFLDLLHQRLYHLYFQCWGKYRPFIRVAEEKNPQDLERLFCLVGLGEKELRYGVADAASLLRYAGLLAQPRSALGMQTLLRDALGVLKLEVEQCLLRRVSIPEDQRTRLGVANSTLGVNAVLGSEMPDVMGKFRIRIGPLSKAEFDSLLPGTPKYRRLARLIRLYSADPLDFDLKLILAAGEAQPILLGDPNGPRLGWNSWCFSGDTLGEVGSVFPLAQSAEQPPGQVNVADQAGPAAEAARPSTLTGYYQQELARLRDLAAEFAGRHPELTSLVSGNMADPTVERLFQGVAFLNASLQQKLDDDLPELIQEFTGALHPWDLRPIPATTIVAFTPKPELAQPLVIAAAAEVASLPIQGAKCRFRTCFEVTVHPLTLLNALFCQPAGKPPLIRLQFELNGIALSGWSPRSLRFYLGDEHAAACDLYLLLMRHLKRILICSPETGAAIEITAECLKPAAFSEDEALLTKGKGFLPGHLILQEYFLFQDRFLFLDLCGLEASRTLGAGSRFEIQFELAAGLPVLPQLTENSFVLFATPVINLFDQKAKPMTFVDDQPQKIGTASTVPEHHQVYSVDRVSSFDLKTGQRREYSSRGPLLRGSDVDHLCSITHSKSSSGEGFDTLLSIPHAGSDGTLPFRTKLNIDLTCTNGTLPERLNPGAVCVPTATIPEVITFRNFRAVTRAINPDTRHNRQWRLLAGLSLNRTSLELAENLRAILKLYIPVNCNQSAVKANQKRVDSLCAIEARPTDRVIDGSMYRGYDIRIRLRGEHFAGPGDLYLFSSVIERFLGGYVSQSCFIRLAIEEIGGKSRYRWPTRLGDRPLI